MTELDAAALREMAREIQELVAACSAHGDRISPPDVARLGLALADLTRVLPKIEPPATQEYFVMLERLARGALAAMVMRERRDC